MWSPPPIGEDGLLWAQKRVHRSEALLVDIWGFRALVRSTWTGNEAMRYPDPTSCNEHSTINVAKTFSLLPRQMIYATCSWHSNRYCDVTRVRYTAFESLQVDEIFRRSMKVLIRNMELLLEGLRLPEGDWLSSLKNPKQHPAKYFGPFYGMRLTGAGKDSP